MPLNAQCKAIVDMMAAAGGRAIEEMSAAEARAQFAASAEGRRALGGPPQEVSRVEDRSVPADGHSIPVRVYWPSNDRNLPALVYFHGGGWVLGDLEMVDRTCRALANASGCAVISVDYRLAPEHKFPLPAEDAYRATEYVFQNASELGIDAGRIAVGGDSAGGNLATVTALMARDKGGPPIAFQLLIYPVTDYGDDRPSMDEFGGGEYFLTRGAMDWFWQSYLHRAGDGHDPYASPLKANLRGLPPGMLITAECDPIRDQGEEYARRLQEAGVPMEFKRYDGVIHAFFHMFGAMDAGKEAIADAGNALRRALGVSREAGTTA